MAAISCTCTFSRAIVAGNCMTIAITPCKKTSEKRTRHEKVAEQISLATRKLSGNSWNMKEKTSTSITKTHMQLYAWTTIVNSRYWSLPATVKKENLHAQDSELGDCNDKHWLAHQTHANRCHCLQVVHGRMVRTAHSACLKGARDKVATMLLVEDSNTTKDCTDKLPLPLLLPPRRTVQGHVQRRRRRWAEENTHCPTSGGILAL